MRLIRVLTLAALLMPPLASASELVDTYEIISAESGVSEFTADLSGIMSPAYAAYFLISVDVAITKKIAHQPSSEFSVTALRQSRCYVWLSKFAAQAKLPEHAEFYGDMADLWETIGRGGAKDPNSYISAMRELRERGNKMPSPDILSAPDDITPEQFEFFVSSYTTGLWDISRERVQHELLGSG